MADTSEVSQQRSLRIGDTVLLFVREKFGYVYSELSSPAHNHVNVYKVDRERQKDPDFPNVAYATFKVIAPNKYKAQQQYREIQQAWTRTSSEKKQRDFEPSLQSARKYMATEIRENKVEQAKRYGNKLLYGHAIQLVHVSSKKFISLSTEATSRTESNNLLVQLSKENSEGCIFKILPRYKVRSEGDQVRYGDQVKLESLKTAGQYLHCSSQTFSSTDILRDQYELNLSATETALTVVLHYCPFENDVSKAVRAGCCLRLFHREYESYVVAEGSFANDPPVRENVHCRQRKVDQKGHSMPSTSSNTYWQIEKESDSRSGDVLLWGERCRIKHLTTRLYLTVQKIDEKWTIGLKKRGFREDDPKDLDTLFNFHSLLKEGDEVQLESYARIKHLLSDTWLHVDGGQYERQWFDPSARGLAGLQWDSARLLTLTTCQVMGDYDAFTLQEVEEPLLDKFNHVAGIVPVLHGYITHTMSDSSDQTSVEKMEPRVRAALAGLCQWLKEHKTERESKDKQKLLRNLMVLEQLMEVLKRTESITITPLAPSTYKSICRECYGILKQYLKGESRKNENYLARFIEFFQKQVGMELNAEEVLVEIVQDNFAIVSRMAQTQMDYMIGQLNATKDPRFLNFLSSLCVCSNRPIPSTQNRILDELVVKFGTNLFIRTDVTDDGSVMCKWEGQSEPVDIHSLGEKTGIFKFLEAQLHLFARLCKGNNAYAIEQICCAKGSPTGYVCFEEVIACAKSKTLSYILKSRYVELILVMFVAVGENRSFLDHLCYSFDYKQLEAEPYSSTSSDEKTALTGVSNEHFPVLKTWILETLGVKKVEVKKKHEQHILETVEVKKELVCDEQHIPHNEVLAQILDLLCHLVNYGYYDDQNDINDVLVPLIVLLNGKTDEPGHNGDSSEEFKNKGRMRLTKANKAVFAVKKKALDVVDMFLKFKCYVQLQVFMYDFKILEGGARRTVKHKQDDHLYAVLKQLMSVDKGVKVRPLCILDKPELTKVVRKRLQEISIEKDSVGQVPVEELKDILIDLSKYECDGLIRHSLILLTGIHFLEHTLFTHAAHTQLLIAPQSITRQELIESTLPQLRHLLNVDCDVNDQLSIVRKLELLSEECTLFNDKEPHRENQLLLYNYGVLSDLLSYVLRKGTKQRGDMSSAELDYYEGREETPEVNAQKEVFKSCFKLLQALAFKNEMVQRRLFNRLSELLKIRVAVHDMAQVLTEIFSGGADICLKVREEDVETIFKLIVASSKDASTQAELMNALQALAKIEEYNLPVSRSQDLIIKYYCKYRDDIDHCDHHGHTADQCHHIVGDGQGNIQYRKGLLERAAADKSTFDPHLQLLLSLTDLLATCAEGDNLFIASVCQKIFSVKELIGIMCSEDLRPEVKRPFVRYLIHVYMYTNGDRDSQDDAILAHGDDMWGYLDHVAELLRNFKFMLQKVPDQNKQQFRRGLVASVRQRTYSFSRRIRPMTLIVTTQNIPHMTGRDGEILPGFLEYFTQGIVLFLYVFYKFFFSLDTAESERQRETELRVTREISRALFDLGQVIVDFISNSAHLQQFLETLYHICTLKVGSVQVCHKELSRLSQRIWHRCQFASRSVERYKSLYCDQIELNKRFHAFVRNYQLAYLGPNTAAHQIQSPAKNIPYNECGEELPLGPNFQELVKCYSKPPPVAAGISIKLEINPDAERLLAQLEISLSSEEHLSEADQQQQDMLDIRCLQILRALIHNRIKSVDPEMKDSNAAKYRKWCIKQLHPVQEEIQAFRNAAKRVLPLLSHPNDAITNEVLSLLKALLFSGNEIVQEGLQDFVKDTREEYLFANLKKKLDNAAERYKESRRLQSQLISRREFAQKVGHTFGLNVTKRESIDQRKPFAIQQPSQVQVIIEEDESVTLIGARDIPPSPSHNGAQSLERSLTMEMQSLRVGYNGFSSEQRSGGGADDVLEMEVDPVAMFKPDTSTALVLEVIGLMCDGQRGSMQDYLREQSDNFRTINVVADVAVFLQIYTNQMCSDNYKQIKEILQALTEMCVGNAENQQVILDKHVVDSINRILLLKGPIPSPMKKNRWIFNRAVKSEAKLKPVAVMVLEMKLKAVELLEVMLERTSSQKSEDIKIGLQVPINKDSLLQTMVYFKEMESDGIVKEWDMNDDASRGKFRAYHVLMTLMTPEEIEEKFQTLCNDEKAANEKSQESSKKEECSEVKLQKDDKSESEESVKLFTASASAMQSVWKKCQGSSRSVEINYHDEEGSEILTKVYFSHEQDELRDELVDTVKWNINRDSMEDKQRALLDIFKPLKKDLRHQERLRKHYLHYSITALHQARHRLLILLTLILDLFVLFLFKVPDERLNNTCSAASSNATSNLSTLPVHPTTEKWFGCYLLYVLGSIHLLLSLWMVIEYYIINEPHFRLPQFFYRFVKGTVKMLMASKCFKNRRKIKLITPKPTLLDVNLFGLRSVWVIVFLTCSILSLVWYGYFYCICAFHIIVNNDILQRVLRAVTKNGVALIMVLILGLVVLFFFAVLSFAFLHNNFYQTDDGDLYCDTLLQCFVSVIRFGLIDNLGLIIPLDVESNTKRPPFYIAGWRLLLDVTFFILVTTIGLNIVFGIIVDAFSELRDEKSSIEEDQKSKCFICDLPSHDFDRKSGSKGFRDHVKKDHNMWNYVYYSNYLDSIDTSDHTAIQKYVYELINDNKSDFFPKEKALCLGGEEDQADAQLEQIQEMIEDLLLRYRKKDVTKSADARKAEQKRWEESVLRPRRTLPVQ